MPLFNNFFRRESDINPTPPKFFSNDNRKTIKERGGELRGEQKREREPERERERQKHDLFFSLSAIHTTKKQTCHTKNAIPSPIPVSIQINKKSAFYLPACVKAAAAAISLREKYNACFFLITFLHFFKFFSLSHYPSPPSPSLSLSRRSRPTSPLSPSLSSPGRA